MSPHPSPTHSVLCMLVLSVVFAAPSAAAAQTVGETIIANVAVVDVRQGTVLADRDVVISGDEIVSVTAAGAGDPPTDATVIDGRGAYLIPGLLDMHAHLRGNGIPAWVTTDWMMPLILAHGVTGVRDMNSDCDGPDQGPVCFDQIREWQASIEAGELVGPRILATSSFLINPPWDYDVSEEEARQLVAALDGMGITNLKVYDRLSPEALAWMADAAASRGLGIWGHVPLRMTAAEASRLGMRSIEHARDFLFDCFPGTEDFRRTARSSTAPVEVMREMVDQHDPAACADVFAVLFENETWYVPTHVTRKRDALAGDPAARSDPRAKYVIPALFEDWLRHLDRIVAADSAAGGATFVDFYRKGLDLTGAAHEAGVRILVGSDSPDPLVIPGSAVHDEIAELVAAGLSPAEALRAATWNGAEFLGITDRYGSIETGKRADLVLLDGNPLDDVRHTRRIRAVFVGGEYLDRAALDRMLADVEAAAQRPLVPGN